jgi:hypothetical protein
MVTARRRDEELDDDELEALFRSAAEQQVARQLVAGYPVYSSGIGPDADKLYMEMPDGRCFQYELGPDGQPMLLRELAP